MNIYMNVSEFEQDIRILIMAFFVGENMTVVSGQGYFEEKRPATVIFDKEKENTFFAVHLDEKLWFGYYENGVCVTQKEDCFAETERKERKDHLKKVIYQVLSEVLQKDLPWGTLTGIRPVKMVRQAMEQNVPEEEIRASLGEKYLISNEKLDLSVKVAQTEIDSLKGIPYENGYSLYVGIPFCPSRCAYCSFTSYSLSVWHEKVDAYIDKLCQEIQFATELFGKDRINTIYMGGGTPTTLEPYQMDKLLTVIEEETKQSVIHEFTVEAGRPDSVTKEKLQVLRDHNISRISINPQTMKDETLRRIGRRHTVAQTIEAYELARSLGFDNINMDMIVGLPGEEEKDVEETLRQIKALAPDNLTVHTLAIKRAARLNTDKEQYEEYKSMNSSTLMDLTSQYAKEMGMVPYYLYRQKNMTGNFENVGYGKPDKVALYNILIMEEMQTIAAVGAGASTKLYIPSENRIERVENVKDVAVYLERFDEMLKRKKDAVCKEEGKLFYGK